MAIYRGKVAFTVFKPLQAFLFISFVMETDYDRFMCKLNNKIDAGKMNNNNGLYRT